MNARKFLIINLDGNAVTCNANRVFVLAESLLQHIADNQYEGLYAFTSQNSVKKHETQISSYAENLLIQNMMKGIQNATKLQCYGLAIYNPETNTIRPQLLSVISHVQTVATEGNIILDYLGSSFLLCMSAIKDLEPQMLCPRVDLDIYGYFVDLEEKPFLLKKIEFFNFPFEQINQHKFTSITLNPNVQLIEQIQINPHIDRQLRALSSQHQNIQSQISTETKNNIEQKSDLPEVPKSMSDFAKYYKLPVQALFSTKHPASVTSVQSPQTPKVSGSDLWAKPVNIPSHERTMESKAQNLQQVSKAKHSFCVIT